MRFRPVAFAALLAAAVSCEPTSPPGPSVPANETYAASLGVDIPSMVRIDDNVYYQDLVVGTGAAAAENKRVVVAYTGYLVDGTSFTEGAQETPPTLLSSSEFIAGWVLGIPGMKVGGKRKLVVGSSYAYGSRGSGPIPGNATLVFDVELKSVQ